MFTGLMERMMRMSLRGLSDTIETFRWCDAAGFQVPGVARQPGMVGSRRSYAALFAPGV